MSFFNCPWLRKVVRPVSPSDVARSYQNNYSGGATQQGHAQGPLSGYDNIPPLSQNQAENFYHMLRRRFSRESKSSNDHREPGKLALPFSLKARSTTKPGTGLTVVEDIGSSLMSERGYDSDARNIPTPTRANHMGASPAARGFCRMELSDLVERSQERDGSERWTPDQSQPNSDSRGSPFGMHYIPTPKSSLRGVPRQNRDMNSQRPVLEDERLRGEHAMQMGLARSLPNLTASNQVSGSPPSRHSPAPGGPGVADDVNLMAHWDQYLKRGQKNGMATSGSVPNLSTDVLVSNKRQPPTSGISFTDPRSLNLGDLGISHRLASQTISSGSNSRNPSSLDLVRNNRYGPFVSSSHENLQPRQRSPQGHMIRRDPSSFYSRQGSHPSSTNTSPRIQSPRVSAEKPTHAYQGIKEKAQGVGPALDHGYFHKSRFHEHCDAVNSPSHHQGQPYDPNDLGSTRRVSAGWMSGGRRVGYGYSPVPGAEEAWNQREDDSVHSKQAPGLGTYPVLADPNMKNEGGVQSQGRRRDPRETVETTIQEPNPIPPPMSPKRHEIGPATAPRARISPQSTKDYPMPPYLRAFSGSRANRSSRDYETGAFWVDEINTPDLRAPEVPPTTQNEHCEVPKSSHYTTHPNDASATRWARLSRSMNVQPRARKAGEGLDGHGTGSNCDSRSEIGQSVAKLGDTAEDNPSDRLVTEYPAAEHLDAEHADEDEDQAGQMHPSNSRSSRWLLKLSKRRASRRLSNIHNQDPSPASSAPFDDCDSNSAGLTNSTKSSEAEDPASTYRECLRMPGSFDGSRWANRRSRVLWDMVTTGDDY